MDASFRLPSPNRSRRSARNIATVVGAVVGVGSEPDEPRKVCLPRGLVLPEPRRRILEVSEPVRARPARSAATAVDADPERARQHPAARLPVERTSRREPGTGFLLSSAPPRSPRSARSSGRGRRSPRHGNLPTRAPGRAPTRADTSSSRSPGRPRTAGLGAWRTSRLQNLLEAPELRERAGSPSSRISGVDR